MTAWAAERMTPKMQALLGRLGESFEETVTHEELMRAVYGPEILLPADRNNLKSLVCLLRKYLAANSRLVIERDYGFGYALVRGEKAAE